MRVRATVMAMAAFGVALAGCSDDASDAVEDVDVQGAASDVSANDEPNAETKVEDAKSAEAEVRAYIDTLLGAYNSGNPVNYMGDPATAFEPELAAKLGALNAEGAATGSIPDALGADAICGCQDWDTVKHTIQSVTITGDRATVAATVTIFGETANRTFELLKTEAGWRVYDLDDGFRANVMGS